MLIRTNRLDLGTIFIPLLAPLLHWRGSNNWHNINKLIKNKVLSNFSEGEGQTERGVQAFHQINTSVTKRHENGEYCQRKKEILMSVYHPYQICNFASWK
jgi:hypothetical protein